MSFILVFRPHQRLAWAEAFIDEQQFVDAWVAGVYGQSCVAPRPEFGEVATYAAAEEQVGHALHGLTRLDSPEEVARYLDKGSYAGRHNKGLSAVEQAAGELGWLPKEEDDEA